MLRKKDKSAEEFWQEYEEKIGEKVLARSLGRYLSGWQEFDERGSSNLWGLVMATSGGFRFHHFPQTSWFTALTQFSGAERPKEKTMFIPKERIRSAQIWKENCWWKKILSPSTPRLIIRYQLDDGEERELILETDTKSDELAKLLV
jgi:hypothetical protein